MPSVPRRRQFTASFTDEHGFEGSETFRLGRLRINRSPDLPVELIEFEGEAGALLGWPTRRRPAGDVAEAQLGELAGSWVLVTEHHVIPDPLGSYATVFSSDLGTVASTAALLPRPELRPRASLNETLGLPHRNHFYPFGLTPWENVARLLPNHRLDLATWQTHRTNRPASVLDQDEALELIADNLRHNLSAISETGPVMLGVTAGNETRMLLAGLKDAPDVYGFTFGTTTTMDTRTARQLAPKAGIQWELRENRVDAAVSQRWFEHVGECVAGLTLRNAAAKESLPADRVYLKGMGGEIARAYYYPRSSTITRRAMTPEALVKVTHLPPHPELHLAAERWLASVDARDVPDLLDLHYWDNRIGSWAAPQTHADQTPLQVAYPLNQHSTLDAMRSLPMHVKQSDRLSPLVVERLWPDLLTIPINQDLLWRRIARRGKRSVSALRK